MQIDWGYLASVVSSPEFLLTLLVIIYLIIAVGFGAYRSKTYLKKHPDEKKGKDYHQQNETVALTLAGFSLTALALLISIRFTELSSVSSILLFFSESLLFFVISFIALRFRFVNFLVYVSDVLLNAGLLSIACGFLVFLGENVSWFDGSTLVFSILVIVLFLASLANYILFDKYSRMMNEVKK